MTIGSDPHKPSEVARGGKDPNAPRGSFMQVAYGFLLCKLRDVALDRRKIKDNLANDKREMEMEMTLLGR